MYRIPDFFGGKDHDFEEGGFCEVGEIFFWKIEQEKFSGKVFGGRCLVKKEEEFVLYYD